MASQKSALFISELTAQTCGFDNEFFERRADVKHLRLCASSMKPNY
jgi:hypothetical protein